MKLMIAHLESCGTNYQTDYIVDNLENNFELTKNFNEADIIVMVGSCCCTDMQLENTLTLIQYIIENKKITTKTYLTGCITRKFKDIPKLQEIEKYLKDNIDYIIDHYEPKKLLEYIYKEDLNKIPKHSGKYKYGDNSASLYIQNGCTHNCTFCKTNYLNCNLKDAPIEEIKKAIDFLDEKNISNIELRGLNLSQYGLDLYKKYKLMEICEYIEGKKNISNISLAGFAFNDAIKNNFANSLKYFEKKYVINGSLESGSNRILKLMNKGFTQEEFLEFHHKINSNFKKEYILNIISGFPTETKEDCLETLRILKEIAPILVNINTYYPSQFTPSNDLRELSTGEFREHIRIYSKILKNNSIQYRLNGGN